MARGIKSLGCCLVSTDSGSVDIDGVCLHCLFQHFSFVFRCRVLRLDID